MGVLLHQVPGFYPPSLMPYGSTVASWKTTRAAAECLAGRAPIFDDEDFRVYHLSSLADNPSTPGM